jgi:hypothetical protein
MVGHMTLDHGIGVRIPASQPLWFCVFLQAIKRFPKNRQSENLRQLVAILVILCGISVTWG